MQVFARILGLTINLSLLLCCSAATRLHAQTTSTKVGNEAIKFDEYGSVGGCDHSARLDNLAIQVQNNPNLEAQIVAYGPEGEGSGSGAYLLDAIKNYLVDSRGLEGDRIKTIYGGRNSSLREPRVELWVAPRGALPPELTKYENDFDTFSGKFAEYEGWDSIAEGEGPGLSIAGPTSASFAEMLKTRKNTTAYVVAFNGAEAAPGAWRRVAQLDIEDLQRRGVEPNRLKLIYGGSKKETQLQLWILPVDAPPPVKEADPEPLPEKTIQIGSFDEYDLAEESKERWAFNGFFDVLRQNEKLRACVIVRFEVADSAQEANEENSTPTPGPTEFNEIPRADLLNLVEKWKTKLAATYKIQPGRFIVLFATASEYSGASLETWIVPPGAPLPDPNAEAKAEEVPEDAVPPEEKTPPLR